MWIKVAFLFIPVCSFTSLTVSLGDFWINTSFFFELTAVWLNQWIYTTDWRGPKAVTDLFVMKFATISCLTFKRMRFSECWNQTIFFMSKLIEHKKLYLNRSAWKHRFLTNTHWINAGKYKKYKKYTPIDVNSEKKVNRLESLMLAILARFTCENHKLHFKFIFAFQKTFRSYDENIHHI